MLANVGVGSVPVVGVLFDALWKVNVKNLEMALEDLAAPAEADSVDAPDGDGDAEAVTIDVE